MLGEGLVRSQLPQTQHAHFFAVIRAAMGSGAKKGGVKRSCTSRCRTPSPAARSRKKRKQSGRSSHRHHAHRSASLRSHSISAVASRYTTARDEQRLRHAERKRFSNCLCYLLRYGNPRKQGLHVHVDGEGRDWVTLEAAAQWEPFGAPVKGWTPAGIRQFVLASAEPPSGARFVLRNVGGVDLISSVKNSGIDPEKWHKRPLPPWMTENNAAAPAEAQPSPRKRTASAQSQQLRRQRSRQQQAQPRSRSASVHSDTPLLASDSSGDDQKSPTSCSHSPAPPAACAASAPNALPSPAGTADLPPPQQETQAMAPMPQPRAEPWEPMRGAAAALVGLTGNNARLNGCTAVVINQGVSNVWRVNVFDEDALWQGVWLLPRSNLAQAGTATSSSQPAAQPVAAAGAAPVLPDPSAPTTVASSPRRRRAHRTPACEGSPTQCTRRHRWRRHQRSCGSQPARSPERSGPQAEAQPLDAAALPVAPPAVPFFLPPSGPPPAGPILRENSLRTAQLTAYWLQGSSKPRLATDNSSMLPTPREAELQPPPPPPPGAAGVANQQRGTAITLGATPKTSAAAPIAREPSPPGVNYLLEAARFTRAQARLLNGHSMGDAAPAHFRVRCCGLLRDMTVAAVDATPYLLDSRLTCGHLSLAALDTIGQSRYCTAVTLYYAADGCFRAVCDTDPVLGKLLPWDQLVMAPSSLPPPVL